VEKQLIRYAAFELERFTTTVASSSTVCIIHELYPRMPPL